MRAFAFSDRPLDPAAERSALEDPACGGYASFEGWVREENDGRRVLRLDYEAYQELAVAEAERILPGSTPAQAIMAPLSVQSFIGGATKRAPYRVATSSSRQRR